MQFTHSAPRCNVPDTVLRIAEDQFRRLQKFESRIQAADLRFDIDHGLHRVEARITVTGAPLIVAQGSGDSFRTAIDRIVDRLGRQLRRRRERRQRSRVSGVSKDISLAGGR